VLCEIKKYHAAVIIVVAIVDQKVRGGKCEREAQGQNRIEYFNYRRLFLFTEYTLQATHGNDPANIKMTSKF
jgi:hypothetical protein